MVSDCKRSTSIEAIDTIVGRYRFSHRIFYIELRVLYVTRYNVLVLVQ